jgi:hypothetical protein
VGHLDAEAVSEELDPIAHELALALHRCSSFLPLFINEGPKLRSAIAVNARVEEALRSYCTYAGIRRQDLNEYPAPSVPRHPAPPPAEPPQPGVRTMDLLEP